MAELQLRLRNTVELPDIIMITEVKPKNARYKVTEGELKLGGYDIYSNLTLVNGRGIIIYVKVKLHVRETKVGSSYQESVWITIGLQGGDELLVGCIYRSPNSDKNNNECLRSSIKEAYNMNKSHILIVGDFNYPRIDWESWYTPGDDTSSDEYIFIETLRDTYLHQHVVSHTRGRGTDQPRLLDLVLTNEEGMVEKLKNDAPLGKSDHSLIEFNFIGRTEDNRRGEDSFTTRTTISK